MAGVDYVCGDGTLIKGMRDSIQTKARHQSLGKRNGCKLTKKNDGVGVYNRQAESDRYRYQEKECVEICTQSTTNEVFEYRVHT